MKEGGAGETADFQWDSSALPLQAWGFAGPTQAPDPHGEWVRPTPCG
jgi:hypothetical protein